jgi:hypothetical protein
MKYTPANTIVPALLAAAIRDSASESPTWSVVVGQDHGVPLLREPPDLLSPGRDRGTGHRLLLPPQVFA